VGLRLEGDAVGDFSLLMTFIVSGTESVCLVVAIDLVLELFNGFHNFGIGALADGTEEMLEGLNGDDPLVVMG